MRLGRWICTDQYLTSFTKIVNESKSPGLFWGLRISSTSCSFIVRSFHSNRPEFPSAPYHPHCQHSAAECDGRMGLEQTCDHQHRFDTTHEEFHPGSHQRSHRCWCDEGLLNWPLWDWFLMLNSFSPDVFRNRFWDGQPVSHHEPHRLGPQHPHTLSQAKHTGPICRHRQPWGELWRSVYHISTCACLSSPLLSVEWNFYFLVQVPGSPASPPLPLGQALSCLPWAPHRGLLRPPSIQLAFLHGNQVLEVVEDGKPKAKALLHSQSPAPATPPCLTIPPRTDPTTTSVFLQWEGARPAQGTKHRRA